MISSPFFFFSFSSSSELSVQDRQCHAPCIESSMSILNHIGMWTSEAHPDYLIPTLFVDHIILFSPLHLLYHQLSSSFFNSIPHPFKTICANLIFFQILAITQEYSWYVWQIIPFCLGGLPFCHILFLGFPYCFLPWKGVGWWLHIHTFQFTVEIQNVRDKALFLTEQSKVSPERQTFHSFLIFYKI